MANAPSDRANLPVVLDAPLRVATDRVSPQAAFLSQLIAERYHMSTQRARRRAPVAVALETYDSGARVTALRLPAGYRTTIIV